MDRYIGKLLDNRYEILEVIGSGGMAMVYKARCRRLNRFVAIKILKDEHLKDAEFRSRFHDESQAVAMLSHPNIVSVYDVSRTGSVEYIVMELIEGITLKDYLTRKGALSWKETLFFATQIAKGLNHAHSRGIIHRDIKPQNLMLLRDGTIKIADFGIARVSFTNDQATAANQEALGSVHYVAPEQAKGSHIDGRADIYSLGVVMYEMLTGRLPFEGDTPVAVAIQHINAIPLNPRDIKPDIPQALEDITMKAMNPSLRYRYATAAEMLNDLEKFRQNPQVVFDYSADNGTNPSEEEGETKKLGADLVPVAHSGERALQKKISKTIAHRPARELKQQDGFEDRKRGDSKSFIAILSALLAAMIFFTGAIFFAWHLLNPSEGNTTSLLNAPSLVGKNIDAAKEEYKDYNIVQSETQYSDSDPEGTIIKQSPEANRPMRSGNTIEVTVSLGKKVKTVPNLENYDRQQAFIELSRLDIQYELKTEASDTIPENYVIRTVPAGGETISADDKIILVVSTGKEGAILMPTLTGLSEQAARDALQSAGLLAGTVTPVTSDKPEGTVVSQQYETGTKLDAQTPVNFEISGGASSTQTTAPVQTTKPPVQVKTIKVPINLEPYSGLVRLTVKMNGTQVYDEKIQGGDTVYLNLTGSGSGYISVFVDNKLIGEQVVRFE